MPKVTWKRRDIATHEEHTVETEVVQGNFGPMVNITIPLEAYQRLVNWASMGRTISAAIGDVRGWEIADELSMCKAALCAVHDACRKKFVQEQLDNAGK